MSTMVIGAAGFVGPYLVDSIRAELDNEIIVTKLCNEQTDISGAVIENLDVLDRKQIFDVIGKYKPQYIFYLAALSSVAASWKNPSLTVDINIKGALNLLDTIREINNYNPRILIVGSGEEYGHIQENEIPIRETNSLHPGNVYAVTKACQNMMATLYSEAYGMDIVLTRSFNHIGPGQKPIFVIADFCSQVAKIEKGQQEAVIKVGNLSAKRDFTDVRDVTKAYIALMKKGRKGETYNVGSGHAISVQDALDMIISKTWKSVKVEIDETKFRPVDVPIIEADITKITKDTGWKPIIPIERSIEEILEFWRKFSEEK